MWRRGISSIIKPGSHIKKLVKCSSQLVSPKTVPEEGISDISSFKVGEVVHGFKVNDMQNVPDFNITAVMLIHDKTKSKYLHLYRNDLNNVFSINFRTTPMDDTGVPHILEHTVLCGSQKYPVRDPFFKMLNRSLATFMNAMTGADLTFYPFSTQNFTDYQNLQKIYCDSVFRPNLNQLDFLQEGWRLENTNPNDKNSELIIKGVVYNEMKGAFAENERLLEQKIQNVLLPDHTYRFISGGDPLKIPDLTWEGLKNFHRTHYHPSNARFFSYGNFPLRPTLKFLNDEYLSHYEFLDPKHTEIPDQKRWEKPQSQEIPCRFENVRGPIEKQNFVSVSLLMSRIIDTYDTFLLQFLTELLIKGPNAPFYKSMIEPNFSGGFTQTTGLDTQPKESMFTVGLQGLTKDTMGKVVELFDSTIDEVIKKGFDEKHIESVLHRYELGIKHETSNFGLHLLFGAAPILNHDGPVIEGLKVNALIDRLKREMQNDKEYLQKAVRKYFKDNKHRLVLTMSADKEYEERQLLLEKGVITEKTKSLSNDDKEKIFVINQELLRTQTTPQNIDILPTLKMEDISGDIEKVPKEKIQMGPVSTQINKVNSNGITYFKAILNTSDLTPEQQMLLPLFCYVINKLGAGSYDYREFDSLVNRKTAGLDLSVHIGDSLYQLHSYESGIYISSYCLDKNVDAMFDLWTQIFKISNLTDVERFSTLVKLYMTNLTSGLADSGHAYAMQAAAGLVSGSAYQKELLTGLQHIAYMKRLAHTASYKAMLLEISNIAKTLFDKHKMRCCLNLTESNKKSIVSSYEKFITGLPGNVPSIPPGIYTTTKVWTPTDSVNCQHHVLNLPVNYCSKAILTVPYTNPDYARLRIFSRLLSTKYLHPELREKQGAYGGGARLRDDGVFVFYTYRDPRNLQTLDVFDDSYKWMQQELGRVTQQDLLEAKFGVFQTVDAPIPPSGKGCREFVTGLTPEILQRHRAELMAVDINGLRQVGEKYLSGKLASACSKVVLGPKSESFDTKGRQDELWTVVDT